MSTESPTIKILDENEKIITLATENFVNNLNEIMSNKIQDIESKNITKEIRNSIDFNDFTEDGNYHIDASAIKTNSPSINGGELMVIESDIFIFQIFFTKGIQLFVRYFEVNTNTWSVWNYLSSFRKLYSSATVLSTSNSDLNSSYSYATYSIENPSIQNLPINEEGIVENVIGTKYYHQKYTTLSGKVYVRHYTISSKTWSSWIQI